MTAKEFLNNKYVLIGGAVVLAFGGYSIYKNMQERKRKAQIKNIVNSEEERALQHSMIRTIDDKTAEAIAKSLYNAMDGMGTDETAIYDLICVRNKLTSADIIEINKAFGLQEYGTFGSPFFGSGEFLNLVGWFQKELSNTSSVYIILKTKFNQAGIDWE